ncbi:fimbrial biogenesis chaperone [Candidatus Pantoea multigeneris]|uniref:Molecular chaperone n=1 Tax=Candidatus Pantoea multigeneris TaxID=2608357 RepID=A0ABX0RGP4_9GAMM|nr:molecular chaperone [Pantoea multigeneris]NIF23456.1 molecular chaperone [Pantoea multigeneris]
MSLYRILKHSLLVLSLMCLSSTFANAADHDERPGLTYYVMRVIYPENEKGGVTLTTYNKTDRAWLLQSFIRPVGEEGLPDFDGASNAKMPFIVTPPLERLDAQSELTLRIRRNEVSLPDDRESVFFIAMKAIPAQQENQGTGESKVVLAVVNNMKVFYRPIGLKKRAIEYLDHELRFRKEDHQLIAVNPTPYWITFSHLQAGKQALNKEQLRLMVPPEGERIYTLPQKVTGKIKWQLIDEDGWSTKVRYQN